MYCPTSKACTTAAKFKDVASAASQCAPGKLNDFDQFWRQKHLKQKGPPDEETAMAGISKVKLEIRHGTRKTSFQNAVLQRE
jgi:hypothetical protein